MTDSDPHRTALGDNSISQLRAYVSRIEVLEKDIDAINSDKRETYAEAKACGFCKKTLRKLIVRRKKEHSEIQEEDAMLELYEAAVAGKDETA